MMKKNVIDMLAVKCLFPVLLSVLTGGSACAQTAYQMAGPYEVIAPEGAPLKHDYEVYVQPRGGKEWKRVDTYAAKVNASLPHPPSQGGGTMHKISEISYALFDFTGDVFVRVVSKHRKFTSARIRPDYRGIIANVLNDSTVQFLLFQPENVSVELDGNITDNLLIFTSKPPITKEEAEKKAKQQGRKFIYFPPGLYTQADIDSKTKQIPLPWGGAGGGFSVYLASGSYFTGTFAIEGTHDVSILGQAEPQVDYQGCMAINCGDNNLVRHVLFDNIRIEQIAQGSLFQVKVGYNQKYCAAPGRAVEDVTFRNIRYNSSFLDGGREGMPFLSIANGYDEQRRVSGITFEGLKINGRAIYDNMPGKPGWHATADYVPMFIGNHVERVSFKK